MIEFTVVKNDFTSIIPNALVDHVSETVGVNTFELEREVKESMRGPKAGRTYKRGERIHIASAPGEPPAIDLGTYINTIQSDFTPGSFEGTVGTNSEVGPYLEDGTRHMAPRPHFRPAAEKIRPQFERQLSDGLEGRLG